MGEIDFRSLQTRQAAHDAGYHSDIATLPNSKRLQHYTLHLVKYAGTYSAAVRNNNAALIERTLTDTMIITLAAANALRLDLATTTMPGGQLWDDFAPTYIESVGHMAKAAEAFDHETEMFDSYGAMREHLPVISCALMDEAAIRGVDLATTIPARWEGIEAGVPKRPAHGPERAPVDDPGIDV